jgi:hypothetical protein
VTGAEFEAALHPWQNFYVLTGTAAATLTGLMFLAVTFGSGLVTKENASSSRAFVDPIFFHFVHAFLIACTMSVPTMTAPVLGWLLVGMAAFRLFFLFRIFGTLRKVHRIQGDLEMADWLMNIGLPLVSYALLFVTAAGFLGGRAEAFNGVAIFSIVLIVLGMLSTWELMVWMAVQVNESKAPKS